MAYEQRDNSGSFFINDRKEKDNHPDFKGSIQVDGTDYWLSIWSKSGTKGEFWSVSVTPKEKATGNSQARPITQGTSSLSKKSPPKTNAEALDDDLPF